MANCGKEILLEREGTEQQQRFIEQLDPDFFKLNDFKLEDWLKFAYRFAKHVNYFNTANADDKSGDWQEFFKSDVELEEFQESVDDGKNITPHLALFVQFILKICQVLGAVRRKPPALRGLHRRRPRGVARDSRAESGTWRPWCSGPSRSGCSSSRTSRCATPRCRRSSRRTPGARTN